MRERHPIACNVHAIEDAGGLDARRRHEDVSKRLLASVVRTEEHEDGLALEFPAEVDTLIVAAEFMARERLCCPFLRFSLELEPGGDSVQLVLSGDPGTKAFLEAEFTSNL